MRTLYLALLAAAVVAGPALAQTPAPAPAKAPATTTTAAGTTVKAVQPGLFEVAGPKVNEVIAVGIQKITATPGKGGRSIAVQSPWGNSYWGWPKNVTPVAFTIETGKAGGATISAPGFTEAKRAEYKAAIEAVAALAIASTKQSRNWMETGAPGGN
jgi:hypothetical protein